jgi:hypothetical protein
MARLVLMARSCNATALTSAIGSVTVTFREENKPTGLYLAIPQPCDQL